MLPSSMVRRQSDQMRVPYTNEDETMNLQCDHCPRTASGTELDLLDAGWARITLSAPIRKTYTACPDHGKKIYPILEDDDWGYPSAP